MKKEKGITLIALVITIIILIILAGVSIQLTVGENGIIKKSVQSKDKVKIGEYKEKIELIRVDLQMSNENYTLPTIMQLKNEIDDNQKHWVQSTEIIMDKEIEKLKLITKEGYIFYITETTIEYKGKGEVKDTSELQRNDVINLEIVTQNDKTCTIKIVNLSERDYYQLTYQVGGIDGEWKKIESGEIIEVARGSTIYAKLVYGIESGLIHSLAIENTKPTIEVKNLDVSNLTRKTEIVIGGLFDVIWGNDGAGTIEYTIEGKMAFDNTNFNSTQIKNTSELEIGNYKIICKAISPSNQITIGIKENVNITILANTTVKNQSNNDVSAKAIYSEYDLAYFRDLVNEGNYTLNGKIMNNIDLSKVCHPVGKWGENTYDKEKSWYPIGSYDITKVVELVDEATIYYNGIFEGNNYTISNIYINNAEARRLALFSITREDTNVRKITVKGEIRGKATSSLITAFNLGQIEDCVSNGTVYVSNSLAGGISARNDGIIKNCMTIGSISSGYYLGGICGRNYGTIEQCYNLADVTATKYTNEETAAPVVNAGGIVGINDSLVTKCMNQGEITANYRVVGGIVGRNYDRITYCCNSGNASGEIVIGGIAGNNRGYISYVYNIASQIKSNASSSNVGGIVGNQNTISDAYIKYAYNKATLTGKYPIGGIAGNINTGTISNTYNMGKLDTTSTTGVGQITGYPSTTVTNSQGIMEENMITWDQTTIANNLGKFIKQTNSLPILNTTIPIANIKF